MGAQSFPMILAILLGSVCIQNTIGGIIPNPTWIASPYIPIGPDPAFGYPDVVPATFSDVLFRQLVSSNAFRSIFSRPINGDLAINIGLAIARSLVGELGLRDSYLATNLLTNALTSINPGAGPEAYGRALSNVIGQILITNNILNSDNYSSLANTLTRVIVDAAPVPVFGDVGFGLGTGLGTTLDLGGGLDIVSDANVGGYFNPINDFGLDVDGFAGVGGNLDADLNIGGNLDVDLGLGANIGTGLGINTGLGAGANLGLGVDAGLGLGVGGGLGLNAGLGLGAGAGLGLNTGLGVNAGVGAGLGVNAGLGVGAGLGAGAGLGMGAGLGVNAGVGAGLGVNTGIGAGLGAKAGLGVGLGANAGVGLGANAGVGLGANAGVGLGANVGVGAGLNAGAGIGANLGIGAGLDLDAKVGVGANVGIGADVNVGADVGVGLDVDLSVSAEAIELFKVGLFRELLRDRYFRYVFSDSVPISALQLIASAVAEYLSKAFSLSRSYLMPLESKIAYLSSDLTPSADLYAGIIASTLTDLLSNVNLITTDTSRLEITVAARAISSGLANFLGISSVPGLGLGVSGNTYNSYFSVLNGLEKLPYVGVDAASQKLPAAVKTAKASTFAVRFAKTLYYNLVSSNRFSEGLSLGVPTPSYKIIANSIGNFMAEAFGSPSPSFFTDIYINALLANGNKLNYKSYAKTLSLATTKALYLLGYFLSGNVNVQAAIARNAIIRAFRAKSRVATVPSQVVVYPAENSIPWTTSISGVAPPNSLVKVGSGLGLGLGLGLGVGAGVNVGANVGVGAGLDLGVGANVGVGAGLDLGVGANVGVDADVGLGLGIGAGLGVGTNVGVGANVGVDANVGLGVDADLGLGLGADIGLGADLGLDVDLGLGADLGVRAGLGLDAGIGLGADINAGLGLGGGRGNNRDRSDNSNRNGDRYNSPYRGKRAIDLDFLDLDDLGLDLDAELEADLSLGVSADADIDIDLDTALGVGVEAGANVGVGVGANVGVGVGANVGVGLGANVGVGVGANVGVGVDANVDVGAGIGVNADVDVGVGYGKDPSILTVLPRLLANRLYQSTALFTATTLVGCRKVLNLFAQGLASQFGFAVASVFIKSYAKNVGGAYDNFVGLNIDALATATSDALAAAGILNTTFCIYTADQLAAAIVAKYSSLIVTSLDARDWDVRPKWSYLLNRDLYEPPLSPGYSSFDLYK